MNDACALFCGALTTFGLLALAVVATAVVLATNCIVGCPPKNKRSS